MKRVQFTVEVVIKFPDKFEAQKVADDLETVLYYPGEYGLEPAHVEHVEVTNIQPWKEEG